MTQPIGWTRRRALTALLVAAPLALLAACGGAATATTTATSTTVAVASSAPSSASSTTALATSSAPASSAGSAPASSVGSATSAAATSAAAASTTSASSATAVSIAGRTTLQLWSRFPWLADVAKLYNAGPGEQSKVALQTSIPDDMVTKLTAALAGGTPPDLVTLDDVQCPRFSVAGGFADITSHYNQLSYKNDLVQAMLHQGQAQGKQYQLPFESDTSALLWNKPLLREAGLDAEQGPRTWAEYQTFAQKLTRAPDRYGTWVGPSYTFLFMPWAWMNGGDLLNEDGTTCVLNSPQTAEALDLWMSINVKDRSTPDEDRTGKSYDTQQNLINAKLAIMMGGNANVVSIKQKAPNLEFGTGPFPTPKDGGTTASEAGGDNTGIPSGTKTFDQAWQVLQYLLSSDVQVEFLAKLGSIPVRLSMADNPYFKAEPRFDTFAKTLAVARTPYTPKFNELFKTSDSPLIVRLNEALRGQRAVNEALSLAQNEINALLGK